MPVYFRVPLPGPFVYVRRLGTGVRRGLRRQRGWVGIGWIGWTVVGIFLLLAVALGMGETHTHNPGDPTQSVTTCYYDQLTEQTVCHAG